MMITIFPMLPSVILNDLIFKLHLGGPFAVVSYAVTIFKRILHGDSAPKLASISVGTTATAVFFAMISIIAAGFSFRFIPETCGKNVEELSFLYQRKTMVMDPTGII